MKINTLKCDACGSSVVLSSELRSAHGVTSADGRNLDDRDLFSCKNKDCKEYEVHFVLDNKDNFDE